MHGGVVVIAEPDAANHIAGEGHEPGVAVGIGGAGLACGLDAVEDGAPGGAFLHHLAHHHIHVHGDLRGDHLHRLLAVAVPAPDQLAGAAAHFEHRVRGLRLTEIGEHGVATGVIEHGHFVGADRHRGRVGQRCAQACFARDLPDLGAADFRVAVANRDRQFHGHDIDRTLQSVGERHRA